MKRLARGILGAIVVGAWVVGCGGGGGGDRVAGPTPENPPPPAGPGTGGGEPGGGGGGGGAGGGGTGGGGSSGSSLTAAGFRVLEATVDPPGSGTVSDDLGSAGSALQDCADCSQRYRLGTLVTLTARPAAGRDAAGWRGGPCEGVSGPTCTIRIEANARVTARFR